MVPKKVRSERRVRLASGEKLIVEVEEKRMLNSEQVTNVSRQRSGGASNGPCGLRYTGVPGCAFMRITPEMAAEMLSRNTRNRHLTQSVVDRIFRDINAGRYVLTGNGIQFTKSWVLADGQHRLYAIIASGIPVDCLVVWGLDESVIQVLDDGKKRTFRDQKVIDGTQNARFVAVFTRAAFNAVNSFNRQPSNAELEALYNYAEEGIDWLVGVAKQPSGFSTLPSEVAGALVWAYYENPDELDAFANMVWTGNGIGNSSGARCLNNQMKGWSNKKPATQTQKHRMTLRCIAAHLKSERLSMPKSISDSHGERLHSMFIPKLKDVNKALGGR